MRKKFVLLTVTLLLSLGVCEVIVRVFFRDRVDSDILRKQFLSASQFGEPSLNPNLVFELKKNVTVDFEGVRYIMNEDRRRVANLDREKEVPGALKVAVIGDSTSFGWGVPFKASYPYLLTDRLSVYLDHPVSMRNYSVGVYNTAQELEVYRTKVRPWQPDVILIHHDGNDANPKGRYVLKDCRNPDFGNNILHSALVKMVVRACDSVAPEIGFDLSKHEMLHYSITSGPRFEQHLVSLQTLIDEAERDGAAVLTVLYDAFVYTDVPLDQDKTYLKLHAPLTSRLKGNIFDLYPSVREVLMRQGKTSRDYWLGERDIHPNKRMHRIIANILMAPFRAICLEKRPDLHERPERPFPETPHNRNVL